MSSDVKEILGIGTSNEFVIEHIADGMLGYLIKCLFFTLKSSSVAGHPVSGRLVCPAAEDDFVICGNAHMDPIIFTIQK